MPRIDIDLEYYFAVAVITCDPLAQVDHATKDTDLAIYETVVTLTCDPGFKVSGLVNVTVTEQVVTCSVNGTWDALPNPCEGQSNKHKLIYNITIMSINSNIAIIISIIQYLEYSGHLNN